MCADRPLPPLQKGQIFYTAKSVFVRQTVGCAIFGRTKISLTFAGKTFSVKAFQVSLPTLRFSAGLTVETENANLSFLQSMQKQFCSRGFCQTDGVKCCLGVVLVLYLGKQFAKKPLPTTVCKRQTYVQKIKNKLGKNAILSLVQSMQKQFLQ